MSSQTLKAKLPKSVKRITIVKASAEGAEADTDRVVVQQKRKKRSRSKGLLKILERATLMVARANQTAADSYLEQHRQSNRKRGDGWLRNFAYNFIRSNRKGNSKVKISTLLD